MSKKQSAPSVIFRKTGIFIRYGDGEEQRVGDPIRELRSAKEFRIRWRIRCRIAGSRQPVAQSSGSVIFAHGENDRFQRAVD